MTTGGKRIIVLDFSKLKSNNEIIKVMQEARVIANGEQKGSILFLTDITDLRFDPATKDIFVKFCNDNKAITKKSAVYGVTALTSIMMQAVVKLSGRTNIKSCNDKNEAVQWLLS